MSGARGTAGQQQDRRNAADRARGQADRGTRSQQQDRRNMETAKAAGNRAPGVSRGGNSGGVKAAALDTRTLSPQTPGWGGLGPRGPMAGWGSTPEFNRAMQEYKDRSLGVKALDFLGGSWFDAVKPDPLNPGTYAGGAYHTGTNVPGAALSLAGMATGIPGLSTIGGLLGSQIPGGTVLHGGDPALAGYNTGTGMPGQSIPGGGTGNAGMGGFNRPAGVQPMRPVGAPGAALSQSPQMAWQTMQPAMLGGPVPGLQNYGVNTPGYNYLAKKPAMFG